MAETVETGYVTLPAGLAAHLRQNARFSVSRDELAKIIDSFAGLKTNDWKVNSTLLHNNTGKESTEGNFKQLVMDLARGIRLRLDNKLLDFADLGVIRGKTNYSPKEFDDIKSQLINKIGQEHFNQLANHYAQAAYGRREIFIELGVSQSAYKEIFINTKTKQIKFINQATHLFAQEQAHPLNPGYLTLITGFSSNNPSDLILESVWVSNAYLEEAILCKFQNVDFYKIEAAQHTERSQGRLLQQLLAAGDDELAQEAAWLAIWRFAITEQFVRQTRAKRLPSDQTDNNVYSDFRQCLERVLMPEWLKYFSEGEDRKKLQKIVESEIKISGEIPVKYFLDKNGRSIVDLRADYLNRSAYGITVEARIGESDQCAWQVDLFELAEDGQKKVVVSYRFAENLSLILDSADVVKDQSLATEEPVARLLDISEKQSSVSLEEGAESREQSGVDSSLSPEQMGSKIIQALWDNGLKTFFVDQFSQCFDAVMRDFFQLTPDDCADRLRLYELSSSFKSKDTATVVKNAAERLDSLLMLHNQKFGENGLLLKLDEHLKHAIFSSLDGKARLSKPERDRRVNRKILSCVDALRELIEHVQIGFFDIRIVRIQQKIKTNLAEEDKNNIEQLEALMEERAAWLELENVLAGDVSLAVVMNIPGYKLGVEKRQLGWLVVQAVSEMVQIILELKGKHGAEYGVTTSFNLKGELIARDRAAVGQDRSSVVSTTTVSPSAGSSAVVESSVKLGNGSGLWGKFCHLFSDGLGSNSAEPGPDSTKSGSISINNFQNS